MADNRVSMTVRVGGSTKKFPSEISRGSEYLAERLYDEAVALGRNNSLVHLIGLDRRLNVAVAGSLLEGMRYATVNLIGQRSPPAHEYETDGRFKTLYFDQSTREASGATFRMSSRPQGRVISAKQFKVAGAQELHWRNLSHRTRKMKTPANKDKFFVNTGALKAGLRSMAKSIVNATGVVKVHYLDENNRARPIGYFTRVINTNSKVSGKRLTVTKVPLGRLRISFLPNIPAGMLPGLRSGQLGQHDKSMKFEKKVGISGDLLEKLRGPQIPGQDRHRALLQPVFTFWTLFHLPRRVAKTLVSQLA